MEQLERGFEIHLAEGTADSSRARDGESKLGASGAVHQSMEVTQAKGKMQIADSLRSQFLKMRYSYIPREYAHAFLAIISLL